MRTLHTSPEGVVVAGDWHMDSVWAVASSNWAKTEYNADTIIHLGDFGYTFTKGFRDRLQWRLQRNGQHLYFVDGNHDNHEYLASLPVEEDGTKTVTPRIHYLPRGLRWEWYGVKYLALGGAHSVDRQQRTPGVSWWNGETISLGDARRVIEGGQADIMFCHDVPAGVEIQGLESFRFPETEIRVSERHRELLRGVVDVVRPYMVYSGHYHTRQSLYVGDYGTTVEILDCNSARLGDYWFERNMTTLPEGVIPRETAH